MVAEANASLPPSDEEFANAVAECCVILGKSPCEIVDEMTWPQIQLVIETDAKRTEQTIKTLTERLFNE